MTPAALQLVALAGVAVAAASGTDLPAFLGGMTLQDVGQTVGLGALALLFATDRILTKGQHERRVADILSAHTTLLEEVSASRAYYREAHETEKGRADALARQLAELAVEASRSASATMTALEDAVREVGDGA